MGSSSTYRVVIKPFGTANLFMKGRRIRLDIPSSNFPKHGVNPNTGAAEGTRRTMQIARNNVYLDAAR